MTESQLDARTIFNSYIALGQNPPQEIRQAYIAQLIGEYGLEHGIPYQSPPSSRPIPGVGGATRVDDARVLNAQNNPTPLTETNSFDTVSREEGGTRIDPESFWIDSGAIDAQGNPVMILDEAALNTYLGSWNGFDCDMTLRMSMFVSDIGPLIGQPSYGADIYAETTGALPLSSVLSENAGLTMSVNPAPGNLPTVDQLLPGDVITFADRGSSNGPNAHVWTVIGVNPLTIAESTTDGTCGVNGPCIRTIPVGEMSIYTDPDNPNQLSCWTTQVYRPNPDASLSQYQAVVQEAAPLLDTPAPIVGTAPVIPTAIPLIGIGGEITNFAQTAVDLSAAAAQNTTQPQVITSLAASNPSVQQAVRAINSLYSFDVLNQQDHTLGRRMYDGTQSISQVVTSQAAGGGEFSTQATAIIAALGDLGIQPGTPEFEAILNNAYGGSTQITAEQFLTVANVAVDPVARTRQAMEEALAAVGGALSDGIDFQNIDTNTQDQAYDVQVNGQTFDLAGLLAGEGGLTADEINQVVAEAAGNKQADVRASLEEIQRNAAAFMEASGTTTMSAEDALAFVQHAAAAEQQAGGRGF